MACQDIQKVTYQMRSNLETRSQSENVECFPEAVKGTCAAFDDSQKIQEICERDEHDGSHTVSEAVLDDRLDDCEGLDSDKVRNGQVGSKNYESSTSTPSNDGTDPDGSKNHERSTPSNDGTDPDGSIPEMTRNGCRDASLSPRQPEGNDQAKMPFTSFPIRSSSATLIFYVRKRKRKNVRKEDQDDSLREMMNGHKVDEVDRYVGPNEKPRSNSLPVNSIGGDGIVGRTEQLKYRRKGRVASSGNKKEILVDSGHADVGEMRKVKKWSKEKDKSEIVKVVIDAPAETGVQFQGGISEEKQIVLGLGHRPFRGSGGRHIYLKHVERRIAKEPLNKSTGNSLDVKHLAKRQGLIKKDEKTFASKADIRGVLSNSSGDEAAPPLTKRRRLAMKDMSDSANSSSDDKEQRFSLESRQNVSSIIENPVMHGHKKRRAVRIFDEEDDECPKTPIHGGAPKKLKDSSMPYTIQKTTATNSVNLNNGQGAAAKPTGREATRRKELSPKKYSNARFITKQAPEKQNLSKSVIKFSDSGSERKVSPVPINSPLFISDGLKSRDDHSTKVIQTSDRERPKNNTRFENGDEDMKTQESVMSMKHLIAAAQAKRNQTHLDNGTAKISIDTLASSEVLGRNLIPSPSQLVLTSVSSLAHKDAPNLNQLRNSRSSPTSTHVSQRQANVEIENKKISSEQKGLLSSGTEAAVARDAFEGMIETLSRTKESIRRATRLAIDCAKYGIAHEVVELLIHKLESEPSLHRKVDLFFLVDSITQRSHSHKGIAGASYIPTVQAALPRLLSAAAPNNSGGDENRRQCLKVLRLWLERKIFPKSFLMNCMDDVGTSKKSTTNPRRPSRVERAVDDPLREMEGVLVDEYGSNATFQLSGLRTSHDFEEEEEEEDHGKLRTHHGKGSPRASPVQSTPASGDMGIYDATPSDRYHCVLEDVDQGFNKEDASGQSKDEKYLVRSNSGSESKKLEFFSRMDSAYGVAPGVSTLSAVSQSFLENFPPLPPDSPPPTPSLPYSPPPFPLSAPPAQPPLPSEPASGVLNHTLGAQGRCLINC